MNCVNLNIEELCDWSAPVELTTKYGVRLLRKATPTQSFWSAWRESKPILKDAGISVTKTETGEWEICWWQPLSADEIERRKQAVQASRKASADINVPAPAGLSYRPYQLAGIAYCADAFERIGGALLADEMGLGKTVQAIGLINLDPSIRNVLVVCPSGLKWNWKAELERWLVRPMSIGIINAGDDIVEPADVVIINYDILHKYHAILRDHEWDMLICDEAHYLKEHKARRTQQVLGGNGIPPIPARRRLFLTGTPILNRPIELWTLLHSLDPTRWHSWYSYAKRYCDLTRTRFGTVVSGASNLEELQTVLRQTVMVRRLKADVLTELPPKIRQVVVIKSPDLDPFVREEVELWEQTRADVEQAKRDVAEAKKLDNKTAYIEAVKRLRECATTAFTKMAVVRHKLAVAKCPAVIQHIEQELESVDKIVVFAHHHDVLQTIADYFGDQSARVWGEIDAQERFESVRKFTTDPSVHVLVGGIHAAGFGLNLQCAQEALFAELDWTPAVVSQCEDRLHRMGQTDSVLVKHLVVDGSLDVRMAHELIKKQEILDRALDDEITQEIVVP